MGKINVSGKSKKLIERHETFYSYDGKNYFDHLNAINHHSHTPIADIEGKLLAVGGHSPDNNKTEIFDIDTNTWTAKSEFPFCSER